MHRPSDQTVAQLAPGQYHSQRHRLRTLYPSSKTGPTLQPRRMSSCFKRKWRISRLVQSLCSCCCLRAHVAMSKMKNSVRRGLFHPDDIKVLGLASGSPGPMSAPLPSLSRKPSRPCLSPISGMGPALTGSMRSHSRSSSFVGSGSSGSGSFGRSEARRTASTASQAGFGKYAEDDDEDYLAELVSSLRSMYGCF